MRAPGEPEPGAAAAVSAYLRPHDTHALKEAIEGHMRHICSLHVTEDTCLQEAGQAAARARARAVRQTRQPAGCRGLCAQVPCARQCLFKDIWNICP